MLLVLIDRDGTIIEDVDFLGKNEYWKEEIKFKKEVLDLLKYIQNSDVKFFIITNQSGVARKLFSEELVLEINSYINEQLKQQGIEIHVWNYCPDVDLDYVQKMADIDFDSKYVKKLTKRKPSPLMVEEILDKYNLNLSDFAKIIVIGDTEYDKKLSENFGGNFIDVNNNIFEDMKKEFEKFVN